MKKGISLVLTAVLSALIFCSFGRCQASKENLDKDALALITRLVASTRDNGVFGLEGLIVARNPDLPTKEEDARINQLKEFAGGMRKIEQEFRDKHRSLDDEDCIEVVAVSKEQLEKEFPGEKVVVKFTFTYPFDSDMAAKHKAIIWYFFFEKTDTGFRIRKATSQFVSPGASRDFFNIAPSRNYFESGLYCLANSSGTSSPTYSNRGFSTPSTSTAWKNIS